MLRVNGQFKKDLERNDYLGVLCRRFVENYDIPVNLGKKLVEVYNSLSRCEQKSDLLSEIESRICKLENPKTAVIVTLRNYFKQFEDEKS